MFTFMMMVPVLPCLTGQNPFSSVLIPLFLGEFLCYLLNCSIRTLYCESLSRIGLLFALMLEFCRNYFPYLMKKRRFRKIKLSVL